MSSFFESATPKIPASSSSASDPSTPNEPGNSPTKIEVKLRDKSKRRTGSPERPFGIIEIDPEDSNRSNSVESNASSKDSSKNRPLKILEKALFSPSQSRPDSGEYSPRPEDRNRDEKTEEDLYTKEDPSLYFHNRNPTLDSVKKQLGTTKKSDSLDSAQVQQQIACCSKSALNSIYTKAIDTAKKHLPSKNKKNRYSGGFPRSFGEDFHSLGPEGFYYLDDSQTECSLDYRDIEFNRDSYLFNDSDNKRRSENLENLRAPPGGGFSLHNDPNLPELSEEEFFQNHSRQQLSRHQQQQSPEIIQMDHSEEYESALPRESCGDPPRIPENTPLGSIENFPPDLDMSAVPELKPELKRKAPSLFDRLFKRDKTTKPVKGSKARSEPREVEPQKNNRAQSLPPASMIKQQQAQTPSMKITDGKLWFEHKTVPPPLDPNEPVLSNVTRQMPIKLVYGKPPEIIVQEVTNLSDAPLDPASVSGPKTETASSQPTLSSGEKRKSQRPKSIDDLAEKSMLDILDDAIRQLREENQIPIYANQNQPSKITVSPTTGNEETANQQEPNEEESPSKKQKKIMPKMPKFRRETDQKQPVMAGQKRKPASSIKLSKPKFLKKFERKPNEEVQVSDTTDVRASTPDYIVAPLETSESLSKTTSEIPEISIEEVPPSISSDYPNYDLKLDEPMETEIDKKPNRLLRKPKIFAGKKFTRPQIKIRRTKKMEGGHHSPTLQKKKLNGRIPSLKESSQKILGAARRRGAPLLKRQHSIESEGGTGKGSSLRGRKFPGLKSQLPQIPESRSSTLGSHLYESPLFSRKNQQQSSAPGDGPTEIEVPVGIPLDAPYEEMDESTASTNAMSIDAAPSRSPFHRYPDEQTITAPIVQQPQSSEDVFKKMDEKPSVATMEPSDVKIAKLPQFDTTLPEIVVKIPANAQPGLYPGHPSDQSPVEEKPQNKFQEFSQIPDVAMFEPELMTHSSSKRPSLDDPMSAINPLTVHIRQTEVQQPQKPYFETYEPAAKIPGDFDDTEQQQSESLMKPMMEKVDKFKNMAGSFGQSFKTKMKDLIQKKSANEPSSGEYPVKVVDVHLKETDLDGTEQYPPKDSIPAAPTPFNSLEEEPIKPSVSDLAAPINDYRVDTTVDDEEHTDNETKDRKKLLRKFKLPQMPPFTKMSSPPPEGVDFDEQKTGPSFSQKNRERLDNIRFQARKSFNQFTDKLKQQKQVIQERTRSIRTKTPPRFRREPPPRPVAPSGYHAPHDPYNYDLHFASDSELSPGTGVDSLRRSKVFQELADTQQRLEMYMAPVDRNEPRRPPRRKTSSVGQTQPESSIFNRSMPSLTMPPKRMAPPKPPRPPPPSINRFATSLQSVPYSISMVPCEEEISLGTSTNSLWATKDGQGVNGDKRKRFPRRQRCPPEVFYRNVRLGYRPKKSYVELLQKSQPFYNSVNQIALERSHSTGQLYGTHNRRKKSPFGAKQDGGQFPVAPLRKSRTLYVKSRCNNIGDLEQRIKYSTLASKPPMSPTAMSSRATSVASQRHYGSGPGSDYQQYTTEDEYEPAAYAKSQQFYYGSPDSTLKPMAREGQTNNRDPLNWQPYTWKVKRCRSYTELEVRERLKHPMMYQHQKSYPPPLDEEPAHMDGTMDSTDTIVPETEKQRFQRAHSSQPSTTRNRINCPPSPGDENSVPKRIFRWLSSTTSLDQWRNAIGNKISALQQPQNHQQTKPTRVPPRPPLPYNQNIGIGTMEGEGTTPSNSNSNCSSLFYVSTNTNNSQQLEAMHGQNNYYYNNFITDNNHQPDGSSTLTNIHHPHHRPLPPPPIPPRPRLIPAHYATPRRRPLTRDVGCDTSENGFHEFITENQTENEEQRPQTPSKRNRQNSHNKSINQPIAINGNAESIDDEDQLTLVEDPDDRFNRSGSGVTVVANGGNNNSSSVYLDARSQLTTITPTNNNKQNGSQWPPVGTGDYYEEDDDATLNDDLSSLSSSLSQYQSVLESPAGSLKRFQQDPEPSQLSRQKNNSFLHRNTIEFGSGTTTATTVTSLSSLMSTATMTTTTEDYRSADCGTPLLQSTTDSNEDNMKTAATTATTSADDCNVIAFGGADATVTNVSLTKPNTDSNIVNLTENQSSLHKISSTIDNVTDENDDNLVDDEDFEQFQKRFDASPVGQLMQQQLSSKDSSEKEKNLIIMSGVGNGGDDVVVDKDVDRTTPTEINTSETKPPKKDNKNRQSCISTESTESTISTTSSNSSSSSSNTFSFSNTNESSSKTNSLLIQVNQTEYSESIGLQVEEESISASVSHPLTSTISRGTSTPEPKEDLVKKPLISNKKKSNSTACDNFKTPLVKKNTQFKKFNLSSSPTEITRPNPGGMVSANNNNSPSNTMCLMNPSLRENLSSLPKSTPKGGKPDKRYYVAHELYTTERDYVDVLVMLTKEFHDYIEPYVQKQWLDAFFRPLDVVTPINKMLAEDLRKRILVDWDDNPRISDIIIEICPYFKEYSIYIREFDRINLMLDDAIMRFDDFESALKSFENSDRCRKLTVKSYLLKPIQRLPQYRLMLEQYAKQLHPDEHGQEYRDTQKALKIVSDVVDHIERESRMAEQSLTLNELRNRIILTKPIRIVVPGRVLIRRGQLDKVSRKEVHVRYFILFNDVLFYLTPVMNGMYKLKEELPLRGMQVEISPNFPTEFIVRSVKRSFALLTRDEKEREDWVRDLRAAIADYTEKEQSFKNRQSTTSIDPLQYSHSQSELPTDLSVSPKTSTILQPVDHQRASILSTQSGISEYGPYSAISTVEDPYTSHQWKNGLGDLAPVWLHDNRVTQCHSCTAQFTFLNRRHHCRACGQIFCAECSSHQYPLKYLNNKPDRVCDECYEFLSKRDLATAPAGTSSPHSHRSSPNDGSANDETNDQQSTEDNIGIQIRVSVSPQNSIKSSASTVSNSSVATHSASGSNSFFPLRKNRSNSCHELRDNKIKLTEALTTFAMPSTPMPTTNQTNAAINQLSLIRNNNIRLSSRLKQKNFSSVLVEVSANDPTALISGWLHRYTHKKGWKRYWFVIKNMVLYTFKASEDVRALETLPLPGYEVEMAQESIKSFPAEFTIKLSHRCQSTIYFCVETKEQLKRWFDCFKESVTLKA